MDVINRDRVTKNLHKQKIISRICCYIIEMGHNCIHKPSRNYHWNQDISRQSLTIEYSPLKDGGI